MHPLRRSQTWGRREFLKRAASSGREIETRRPMARTRREMLRGAAMRTRESMERRAVAASAAATPGARAGEPALPPLGVVLLNRAAYGPRPGDLAAFEALGGTDAARLVAWVDEQLDPGSIDDSEADARIAASGYTTLGKTLRKLWRQHVVADVEWYERIRPIVETTLVTFLRAVYSRRQLFEVMTEFWHNHFSIYGWEFYEAPTWVHYDRDVIRANALGNFREMLEAVAKSTPMLFYLDNWLNSADGPNENYAREMLELHTLGGESYFGPVPRSEVPLDGNGIQVGFVDEDVFAVTRCLTGWSIEGDPWWDPESGDGRYYYRHDWHDTGAKNVLGVSVPAGQPAERDGLDVLDILASHPGTGRFIAGKLCRRLLGDFPPASLVDAAAAVFTAQADAPDQIAQVVRAILLSPEFAATFGAKVKRPFELVVSAMRAAGADFPFIEDDPDTGSFDWQFYLTGHELFGWHPPNGYPDVAGAWTGTSPRVMTWRLLNWLVDVEDDGGDYRLDVAAQTPAGVRAANDLVDFWVDRVFGRPLDGAVRQELVDFMAQGYNPDFDLPLDSDENTRERLQSMLGLMFLSPDFLWR